MPWLFLPPAIELESASLSFSLPARTRLRRASVATVSTAAGGPTTLRLTLGPALLRLVFEPHLVIDLPPPLGDLGLQGVEYDLRTGAIAPSIFHEGLGLHVGKDSAIDEARAWMRDLVTSTALAVPPYDPTADPDLVPAVRQVLMNLEASAAIAQEAIRDTRVSAQLSIREELAGEAGPGGFRIPAGAAVTVRAELEGGPRQVEIAPRVARITVECASVVLRQGGADQAEVRRFTLRRGGALDVEHVRPLGDAGGIAGVEGLIRLLGALGSSGGLGLDPARLDPAAVEGVVKEEIERALRPALVRWVEDNAGAITGFDLRDVLGIPA
jgi:hypothetical protein